MNIAEKLTQIAENEQRVFEAGRKDYRNEFWDGILSGENWQRKFTGSSWNDKTFYPTKDLVCGEYSNNLFDLCEITDLAGRLRECGVKLDTTKATSRIDYMFNYATKLTTAPYIDVSNCTHSSPLACMFYLCNALKTIEGIRVSDDGLQSLGGSTFSGCKVLENITFYGAIGSNLDFRDCVKLTRASIENIVEHLADNAAGKTLTMSKTAVNNSGLKSAGGAFITFEAEKQNYILSQPISLKAGQTVKVTWEVEDGHYVYKDEEAIQNNRTWGFGLMGEEEGAPHDPSPYIFTASQDGQYQLYWHVVNNGVKVENIPVTVKAVLIDGYGNEITGENLHSFIEGTFYGATVTNCTQWDCLVASKPNWTISLL